MAETTKPLLDRLNVKPGAKVALSGVFEPSFTRLLRTRTSDITTGKPRERCDLVFLSASTMSDLKALRTVKSWIEPNGAIWIVRPKGGRSELRDTDVIEATLAAGLVDNKIASFSETHGAMRAVFRLKDRPQ